MSLPAPAPAAPLRGLYAITSAALCAQPALLLPAAEAALRGGARLLQYRDKLSTPSARLANAQALRALCRRHGALLIVNDDVELAVAAGADGVHVGAADASLAQARAQLGPRAIVGASCGPRLQRALDAAEGGASYVAFGRFFASRTKPDAPQAPLELLGQARAQLRLPLCAIGGVTAANAGALVAAGADLLAVIDAVFGDPAPAAVEAAARAIARQFADG
ncbi:MAG: thiamine phosphate synthase [Nevskia sp.]|nr:thiamine phosphate synthase [Nevskia sp.]